MNYLILVLMFGSLASYALSKIKKNIGSWFNFFVLLYVSYMIYKTGAGTEEKFFSFIPGFESVLSLTHLGKFFALVSFLIITTVSLFIPVWIEKKIKMAASFNLLYLLMSAGVLGALASGDMLTFYVFWEIMVLASLLIVPMGKEESRKAAVIYVVLSSIGSYMYLYATFLSWERYHTLRFSEIAQGLLSEPSNGFKWLVVFLVAAAGIAKSGLFPLHTWLRITHGNAPDTFSAVLSGQLIKMGSYILAVSLGVFPSLKMFPPLYGGVPAVNYVLIAFGAVSIVLGTFMAIRQNDMKMLIAYSSVANSGYIIIGLATLDSVGFAGGLFHVFNHAVAAAMIFLSFAAVVYRTGTTKIDEMGGLIHRMPWTFITYLVGIISLAGIPPTSGFISKWMIFQALVRKGMFLTAAITFVGSVGSFLYVFRPLAGVFLGQLRSKYKDVKEAPTFMLIPMIFLVLLTLYFGVFPGGLLGGIVKVQKELGIPPIQFEGTVIKTPLGQWDTFAVFTMFAVGFIIALILYFLFPKSRKVDLTDQYTAGEYLYTPDLYHYATGFYRFIERLYDRHPSFEKLYEMFSRFFKDIGEGVDTWFYRASPSAYMFWITFVMLIIFWVRW